MLLTATNEDDASVSSWDLAKNVLNGVSTLNSSSPQIQSLVLVLYRTQSFKTLIQKPQRDEFNQSSYIM